MKPNLHPGADGPVHTGAGSRREFLRAGGLAALALTQADVRAASAVADGFLSPFLAFDREIRQFMEARTIPGGALAVVKEGRLAYTRGYGLADRESKLPVKPTSLFRVASISKPFTAVAVLQLVDEKRLKLDAPVWGLLDLPSWVPGGNIADERWKQITVRHLLQHTGGWDRDKSFDPMFRAREIAKTAGVPSPAAPHHVIGYMLRQPLDFDPGTRYAYSNFGYCVLGRVIERITGTSYEKFVQERVLAPIGIRQMRLGASLANQRVEGEVRYYTPDNETADSVFDELSGSASEAGASNPALTPPRETNGVAEPTRQVPSRDGKGVSSGRQRVPWPYGGFCLESMDAHGGWIASAVDLARFAAALHDPEHNPLLKPETIQWMQRPPEPPVWRNDDGSLKDHYYACGWLARPVGNEGRANYWHTGSLPGTFTLLVRRHDGVSWAVLFNQRSDDKKPPDGEIDPALHRAANAVTNWPKSDLFQQYQ